MVQPKADNSTMVPATVTLEHRPTFTVEEYKLWLKQLDTDNEGRIDRKELREAISRRGVCNSGPRAYGNHNGFVDDDSSEVEGLIRFAERELGVRITTDPPVRHGSRDTMGGYYRATTYQKSNNSSDHMAYYEGFIDRLFRLRICSPCL